jgi:hypothetical protein
MLMEHRTNIRRSIESTYDVSFVNPASFEVYLDWLVGGNDEHVWQLDVFIDGRRHEIEENETTPVALYISSLLVPLFAAEGFPTYADHMAQSLYCAESKASFALDWARLVESGEGSVVSPVTADPLVQNGELMFCVQCS